jgi:lipopolysaccharide transport system permease protein
VSGARDSARWREILLYQAYCQLRLESERLYIGYLWWALETVLEMGVLYVVFRELFESPVEHYLSFLLCGLVSWRWLAQSVTRAAASILQNQPLASQVFVPKIVFPLSMLMADAVKFLVGLAVLLVFLLFDGFRPTAAWAAFPIVLAVQFLFIAALSLWAAAAVPFFRSILVGLDVALRFGMFLSGVFFDVGRIGEPLRGWLDANPMTHILAAWRDVLMRGVWPDFAALSVIAALSLVAVVAAHMFVVRHELDYPRLPA